MNLNQIRYALKIGQTRNFTRAAEELYISQPTLSQQIKALEAELGTELFIRGNHREVDFTKAGCIFLEYAQKIETGLDEMKIALQVNKEKTQGEIRLGLLWTFGYAGLGKIVGSFSDAYPYIHLKYRIDGTTALLRMLRRGELDIIVVTRTDELEDDVADFLITPLSESDYYLIVGDKSPFAQYSRITLDEIATTPVKLLMPGYSTTLYRQLKERFENSLSLVEIVGETPLTDATIYMAEANIACGFLAKQTYESYEGYNVRAIPIFPRISRRILAAVDKRSRNIDQTMQLMDYIQYYYRYNKVNGPCDD